MRVLVEGDSDRLAVVTLAGRIGLSPEVVAIGGATNVDSVAEPGDIGLCDRKEERFFARTLERWFVCDPDLEGEFVRALGVDAVLEIIDGQRELVSFGRLQAQPFQRGRSIEQQLERFFGGRSGNKLRYAGLFARAVPIERMPAPLAALFAEVERRR